MAVVVVVVVKVKHTTKFPHTTNLILFNYRRSFSFHSKKKLSLQSKNSNYTQFLICNSEMS
ncbi:hypothetical protein Hanom_Chr13g01214591 [Helianthus anomalus]